MLEIDFHKLIRKGYSIWDTEGEMDNVGSLKKVNWRRGKHTVLKVKKFPPRNLFFVSTVEKFKILEYRKVAILPQGPFNMLIWHPTWNT